MSRAFALLVVVWALGVAGALDQHVNIEKTTNQTNLLEKIRRQLIADNYDYMPSSESDDLSPIQSSLSPPLSNQSTTEPSIHYGQDHKQLEPHIKDIFLPQDTEYFLPRTNDKVDLDDFYIDPNEDGIVRNDLVYYLGGDRLSKGYGSDKITNVKLNDDIKMETTSPKVKYKVLKVKQQNPNRRSLSHRRFIQEEGKDGVVIINLDNDPFPEFRLPRNRRQYMI